MPFTNKLISLLGSIALAYASVKTWSKIKPTRDALFRISEAKAVHIADLRSLISPTSSNSESSKERLVIVRGFIEAAQKYRWSSMPLILVSEASREAGVALQQTWEFISLRDLVRQIFGYRYNIEMKTSLRRIPFVLCGSNEGKHSDHVIIDLQNSSHPLPLRSVFNEMWNKESVPPNHRIFGTEYLVEEKILPLGKEVSVVGICSLQDENLRIRACEELPYFLSEWNKDQLVQWLIIKRHSLFLFSIVLGILSLRVLGYGFPRFWPLRKWRNKNTDDAETGQDTPDEH